MRHTFRILGPLAVAMTIGLTGCQKSNEEIFLESAPPSPEPTAPMDYESSSGQAAPGGGGMMGPAPGAEAPETKAGEEPAPPSEPAAPAVTPPTEEPAPPAEPVPSADEPASPADPAPAPPAGEPAPSSPPQG